MQRTLIALALTASLSTLSGCALNEMFNQETPPAPPQAQALPATPLEPPAAPAQPVLTQDLPTLPQKSVQYPQASSALELNGVDIRGNEATALEESPRVVSGNEVPLRHISTPPSTNPSISVAPTQDAPVRPQGAGDLLPTYASGAQVGLSCDLSLGSMASQQAARISAALAAKLAQPLGEVYVAPTIIPDEYLDCIDDLSAVIANSLAQSGKLQVVGAAASANVTQTISQNSGSATTLPLTIRTLRAANIPYLAVSSIRPLDDGCALTIRLVRVADGITLNQSFVKLKPQAAQ